MNQEMIIMTWPDHARLTELVEQNIHLNQRNIDAKAFKRLQKELERAQLVAAEDLPPDVVTMNTKVQVFDLEMGDRYTFTLSWPDQKNTGNKRVNVLAPLGMALLGSRVGQEIEWPLPNGNCRLRIEEILFQPESGSALRSLGREGCYEEQLDS
jgi:regulator of nucleoside diphosphate kinase